MIKKRTPAFTLIEILVVLLIISIITMVAILSFGDFGRSRRIESTAQRFVMLIPAAQEQAIFQPAVLGLKISNNTYGFYQFQHSAKKPSGYWQQITNINILKTQAVAKDMSIKAEVSGKVIPLTSRKKAAKIKIIFMPSGDVTPFTIYVGGRGELPTYKIIVSSTGIVQLTKIDK